MRAHILTKDTVQEFRSLLRKVEKKYTVKLLESLTKVLQQISDFPTGSGERFFLCVRAYKPEVKYLFLKSQFPAQDGTTSLHDPR